MGSTAKGGFESSLAPLCRRQAAALTVSTTSPALCWGQGRCRTTRPGRAGPLVILIHTDLAFGAGAERKAGSAGQAGLALLAKSSTGRQGGLTVCRHSTAPIKGVSVHLVTNSATIPPFEGLPPPLDNHLAASWQGRCRPALRPGQPVGLGLSSVSRRGLLLTCK